jgi:Cdc6-like AAA superfamily ATPase
MVMGATNPAMQLASDYLESTNTVVFLTGKAGTGKTTFLQNLRQNSKKKLAVVAPTGVAAINAGDMQKETGAMSIITWINLFVSVAHLL